MGEESSEENVDTEAREGEDMQEETINEEPPEDPEVVAIKEEIAKLESTLKEKRRELAYTSDKAEEYSKSGYARKVAEMENMRRARSVSTIHIITSFKIMLIGYSGLWGFPSDYSLHPKTWILTRSSVHHLYLLFDL